MITIKELSEKLNSYPNDFFVYAYEELSGIRRMRACEGSGIGLVILNPQGEGIGWIDTGGEL